MKIGQFGESFIPVFDGVGRVMKAYAETMSARGDEVYVIAPMYDAGYRGQYTYEIVDFLSFRMSHKLPYRIGLKVFDRHFVTRMKQIDLDICHVHGPAFAGNIGIHYAKHKGIPVVGSFHTKFYDDILEVTKMKSVAKMGAKMVADFYSNCDEVWAVSEGTGETLREYGYKGDIVVMPNGTNKRVLNVSKIPEVKAKYGLNDDRPVILFVGQINWKKNLRRVIESCGLLRKEGVDFQLVMAGQGPDEKGVRDLVEKCGIAGNTVMTGHLQDFETLDCLYSLADLFLFPSIYDNAPMVLREAAAQRTPGLVVEGSCAAEVIEDGVNGILGKDTNEDICLKIKQFLSLPKDVKARMGGGSLRHHPYTMGWSPYGYHHREISEPHRQVQVEETIAGAFWSLQLASQDSGSVLYPHTMRTHLRAA